MELAKILAPESCAVGLEGHTKEDVLDSLAELAVRSPRAEALDKTAIGQALKDREAQGSTGFGNEIAIPHAGMAGLEDFLLYIAVDPKGREFDSLDKKKVKIWFVILGPKNRPEDHVQILAAVSRALDGDSLKKELLAAKSGTVVVESFLRRVVEDHEPEQISRKELKLLILILYLDEFLYHILEYFLQEGVEGATILESFGMGQYISDIPLFATFIGFMNEQKNHSRTILATIPAEREEEIVKGIEAITGDLDKKQGAMLMTLDIGTWKGTMKMM